MLAINPKDDIAINPKSCFVLNPAARRNLRAEDYLQMSFCRDRFEQRAYSNRHAVMSIRELSRECCMSDTVYKLTFASYFGCSPHRWFLYQRLDKVLFMLKTSELKIWEIAEECNFATSSHMIYLFRRRFGCTPAQLRQTYLHRLAERHGREFGAMSHRERVHAACNDDTHLMFKR